MKPDGSGNFAGYELWTFTIDGVGSFQTTTQFIAVAGTTPFASGISETGKVVAAAGTDSFAGMTGTISNHGTFVAGQGEPTADNPWLALSQMTGSVCMAQ